MGEGLMSMLGNEEKWWPCENYRAFKSIQKVSGASCERYYVRWKEWREKGPLDTYETDLLIPFVKNYTPFFLPPM